MTARMTVASSILVVTITASGCASRVAAVGYATVAVVVAVRAIQQECVRSDDGCAFSGLLYADVAQLLGIAAGVSWTRASERDDTPAAPPAPSRQELDEAAASSRLEKIGTTNALRARVLARAHARDCDDARRLAARLLEIDPDAVARLKITDREVRACLPQDSPD